MFYTRAHVQALESEIADLKARLAEERKERIELQVRLLDQQNVPAPVETEDPQIDYLKGQLAEARQDCRELRDRLLEKHNVAPLIQSEPQSTKAAIEVIHPWGAMTPDAEDAIRESWLREEAQYLMGQGLDENRARAQAEQNYVEQHQVMK